MLEILNKERITNLFKSVGFEVQDIWVLDNKYHSFIDNFKNCPKDIEIENRNSSNADIVIDKLKRNCKFLLDSIHYFINNPWYLIKTQYGLIEFGPRKRVYHLEWKHTKLNEKLICEEGEEWITSQNKYIHSYDLPALFLNLNKLKKALDESEIK